MNKELAISILGADFLNLKKLLDILLETKKVKRLHYDVMDYDFVNNLSFGPHILNNISKYVNGKIKIDCHMMVKIKNLSVETYLKPFIDSKVDIITFHLESLTKEQLNDFLNIKTKFKQKIGLALKPNTGIEEVIPYINKLDLVLLMSVEPGFGGQTFIPQTELKINDLRNYIKKNNLKTLIQVDGGINNLTIKKCQNSDIVVLGNYLATVKNNSELLQRVSDFNNE